MKINLNVYELWFWRISIPALWILVILLAYLARLEANVTSAQSDLVSEMVKVDKLQNNILLKSGK